MRLAKRAAQRRLSMSGMIFFFSEHHIKQIGFHLLQPFSYIDVIHIICTGDNIHGVFFRQVAEGEDTESTLNCILLTAILLSRVNRFLR
jgi:hypothetical protein